MIRWVLFFSLLIIGRLSYFSEPFGVSVDESTYLSMAEVLHQGGVLYSDAVDRKPPAVIWLYELIGYAFGVWNIHAVHFVFSLIFLALMLMAALILKRICKDQKSIWIGVILFGFLSSCFPREVLSANAEYPMLLCLAFSLWCFLKFFESQLLGWLFVSVLLAAVSTLFKQYGGLVFCFIYIGWVWACFKQRQKFWSLQFRAMGVSVAALFVVYGSVYYYFYSRGAQHDFIYYFLSDGLKYVAKSRSIPNHATAGWSAILGMLVSWPALWWGNILLLKNKIDPKALIVFLGFLGSAITIFLSGRYYTHYFIPAIWFLSLGAAIGFEEIWARKKNLILLFCFVPFLFYAVFNFQREWFSSTWSFTKEKQEAMKTLSSHLKSISSPADKIVVWGMASQIYVMSERGSGTRFIFSDFVSGRQPGYKTDVSVPTLGAEEKFLIDLSEKKPLIIVDTSSANLNDYQWFPLTRFPSIQSYVEQYYSLQPQVAGFSIWMRNAP